MPVLGLYGRNNCSIPADSFQYQSTDSIRKSLTVRLNLIVGLLQGGNYNPDHEHIDTGLLQINDWKPKYDDLLADYYFQSGNCYLLKDDYRHGIEYYRKTLQHSHNNRPLIALVYLNLGDLWFLMQDYDKAIQHYRKAIVILEETSRDYHKIAETIVNMGSAFAGKKEFYRSVQYYLMAEKMYIKHSHPDSAIMGKLYTNLANAFLLDNDFNNSGKYFRLALIYSERKTSHQTEDMAFIFKEVASLYQSTGKSDSALYFLQNARGFLLKQDHLKREDLADIYRLMGDNARGQHLWQKALNYFDTVYQLLKAADTSFRNKNDRNGDHLLSWSARLRILKEKTFAEYQLIMLRQAAGEGIVNSWSDCLSLITLMHAFSRNLGQEGSRLIFNESYRVLYTMAINSGYLLIDPLKDTMTAKMFDLSEKSRSNVLLANLNEEKAMEISGIPDSLIKREKKMRSDIVRITGEYLNDQPVVNRIDLKARLKETGRITDLTDEHDSLIKRFERGFPEYLNLKYNDQYIGKMAIQRKLGKNEFLLEYFIADTNLYIFPFHRIP